MHQTSKYFRTIIQCQPSLDQINVINFLYLNRLILIKTYVGKSIDVIAHTNAALVSLARAGGPSQVTAEDREHITLYTATAGLRAVYADWAQCLSWPLIGSCCHTRPLIGQCPSSIATARDLSSLISVASDLTLEQEL